MNELGLFDEETGEEPACMFCGSNEDCEHLVAIFDVTFGECGGGEMFFVIDELRDIISDKIDEMLNSDHGFQGAKFEDYYDIYKIINEAYHCYEPDNPKILYIDEWMFLHSLRMLLNESGDVYEPSNDIVFESGMPGSSSAMAIYYAREPEKVIEFVKKLLASTVSDLLGNPK